MWYDFKNLSNMSLFDVSDSPFSIDENTFQVTFYDDDSPHCLTVLTISFLLLSIVGFEVPRKTQRP